MYLSIFPLLFHVVCTSPDFMPSLKRLFRNRIYSLIILTSLVAVNGFIGLITFKPKYIEQVYGQSATKAIFLIGMEQKLAFIHFLFSALCSPRQLKQWCYWREVWLRVIRQSENAKLHRPLWVLLLCVCVRASENVCQVTFNYWVANQQGYC